MKYFFLADGWEVGRVWEFGGLWDVLAWRRSPQIERLNLPRQEKDQILWLYRVEEAVIMVEVLPSQALASADPTIGQVVLKRLISAEQVLEILSQSHS